MALFPRELWSFQVTGGLEVEDASPTFLVELWPVPAQPTSEWVLVDGLSHRPPPSYSRMNVALGWHCRTQTFYRGSHVCFTLPVCHLLAL